MPMNHQAYVFDYEAFAGTLRPLLVSALNTQNSAPLQAFIDDHLGQLRDPRTGVPVGTDWRSLWNAQDVQVCGALALTCYYDPRQNIGIGELWQEIDNLVLEEFGADRRLTLGSGLGPNEQRFNPGRQGSYFQTADEVRDNLQVLQKYLVRRAAMRPSLEPVERMLQQAAEADQGLYVTFCPLEPATA